VLQEPARCHRWTASASEIARGAAAALAAICLTISASPAEALDQVGRLEIVKEMDEYTQTLQSRHNRSKGITTDSSSNEYMMHEYAEDMFLPDAWLGMKRCASMAGWAESRMRLFWVGLCFHPAV
jgi:hypothetical protein